jgi:bifunctional non-homologous end joining protein LigD
MRDFRATPEPRGQVQRGSQPKLRYVIQEHAARRLHYDFRLELNGVLKSWAIPKGPSLHPGDKRLAARTEDHPIDYGDFEGVIPQGHYGAGRVLLWDRGTWTPIDDPERGYREGRLRFRLDGRKLHGAWTLVRMRGRNRKEGRGKENWLLIKSRDEESRAGKDADITLLRPESVVSRRTLGQIGQADTQPGHRELAKLAGARKRPLPDVLGAQLATLVDTAPADDAWLFEAKLDGYRMLCRISDGKARLFTRNGLDWSSKMPRCAEAAAALPVRQAWLDGEVVVLDSNGMSSFQALQSAFRAGAQRPIHYYVFDLLYLDGYDLTHSPLVERKRLLAALLKNTGDALRYSDHVEGNGRAFHAEACRRGLEGIIGKRRDAPYVEGRTRSWIKVKCRRQQEFVIGGFTDPRGSRQGFGALLIGVYEQNGALRFAGRVGTGFNTLLLRDLQPRLARLERQTPPFANPPTGAASRGVHWLEPRLVAQVSFAEWTDEGIVRQGSFDGLREDKPARAIVRELATELPGDAETGRPLKRPSRAKPRSREKRAAPARASKRSTGRGEAVRVAGIVLSNPDRVLYPAQRVTKQQLAQYYEAVAEWLLPHLEDRPLTLVRCPEGHEKQCFYQKHLGPAASEALDRVDIEEQVGESKPYAVANSLSAVVALVQMGVLELHTWGSRASLLERPDRMILDLDPDVGLPWSRVVEAAKLTHTLLDELGLASFLKTTGGKGLHVVVPLQRKHSWDEVRSFSQALARHLERALPERFTSGMSKQRRQKKIFIDYLRNARGATAIAAFSTRAKGGAPVSVPLAWDELADDLRSEHFTVHNVVERLRRLRSDPWDGYSKARQSLTAAMRRQLGLE